MRFHGYDDEWNKKQFKECCEFLKGKGISKDDLSETGNPCILYGELYTTYKTAVVRDIKSKTKLNSALLVKSKKNDVIMPGSGETAIDIATSTCIPYDNVLLGGDLNIIRSQLDGIFLSNQINFARRFEIAEVAQGASIVHLHSNDIKNLYLYFPSYNEQLKIAEFSELLDNRIVAQSKIIKELKSYKNIVSNKLLYSDKSVENNRLSSFATLKNGYAFKSSEYEKNGIFKIITIANVTGERYINTENCNKVNFLPTDIQKHQQLKNNDILISLTGNIGRVSLCNQNNCLLNQRVGLLEIKDSNLVEYIYQCLANKHFKKEMTLKGQGAAQLNIGKDDIENYKIPICQKEKKNKICCLLKSLDKKIAIEEKILNDYQLIKKYLLSNMFI